MLISEPDRDILEWQRVVRLLSRAVTLSPPQALPYTILIIKNTCKQMCAVVLNSLYQQFLWRIDVRETHSKSQNLMDVCTQNLVIKSVTVMVFFGLTKLLSRVLSTHI